MNSVAAMPPKSFEVKPKLDESGTPIGELLEISMGPHHPSTHGVFRMDVVLDGETVVKLKPVFGYLHRNHEKIGENISYLSSMPYTDRLDYFCSMTNNWAYALTVEKLAGLAVPERAEYIRVIMAELTRLQNHTCLIGFFVQDMGALGTPMMYAFREREKILDLFESVSGARMMCNYMRFGGVRVDVNDEWIAQTKKVVSDYSEFLDEFGTFLTENEIVLARTQFIGVMSKELAVNASITGPMLRAAGVNYDLRKVDKSAFTAGSISRCRSASTVTFTTATWCAFWKCARVSRFWSRRCAIFLAARSWIRSQNCAAFVRNPAKFTAASRVRRANSDFISSATARRIRIAIACARRVLSI